jgi:3-dehydroquinate dehydratase
VMRTDTAVELARLLDFFEDHKKHMRISAMGVGRLGKASRIALMQNGSVLNYAHLTAPGVEGQLSLAVARRISARGFS